MNDSLVSRNNLFQQAREIIMNADNIVPGDKEGILKLIQALIDIVESTPNLEPDGDSASALSEEIITKHTLLILVKQQADELDALKKLSLSLTSSLNLQNVLDAVVAEAMRLVKNTRAAHIFLYSRGRLTFGAALNSNGERNKALSMPRKDGLTYSVAHSGEAILVEDMSTHQLYVNAPAEWYGSIIGIPLIINNDVVGVMNLSRSTLGGFIQAELRLLGLLADQAAVAISNASLHKIVTEQAKSDIVTGLPNRRALDERLEEEVRYAENTNSQFAVVMMDLDGFKNVNDTYGHGVGDEVLRSAFNYLAARMRTADFLARYGGDELTLILHQTDLSTARVVTDKILDMMKQYVFTHSSGKTLSLGVSGGIAVYPLHSRDGINLLRAADAALYHAKKYNRGGFIVAKNATGPLDESSIYSLNNL